MRETNRQLRLKSRPKGMLAPGDLEFVESPVPELKDGQALARVHYLSIDPTMRIWMADIPQYMPPVAIGEIMNVVLSRMNQFGRVVVCGLISGYNKEDPGLASFGIVLIKRLRAQGFILLDYAPRFTEAGAELGKWMMMRKLKHRETFVEGLERAPDAINMLFTGANIGKLLVRL